MLAAPGGSRPPVPTFTPFTLPRPRQLNAEVDVGRLASGLRLTTPHVQGTSVQNLPVLLQDHVAAASVLARTASGNVVGAPAERVLPAEQAATGAQASSGRAGSASPTSQDKGPLSAGKQGPAAAARARAATPAAAATPPVATAAATAAMAATLGAKGTAPAAPPSPAQALASSPTQAPPHAGGAGTHGAGSTDLAALERELKDQAEDIKRTRSTLAAGWHENPVAAQGDERGSGGKAPVAGAEPPSARKISGGSVKGGVALAVRAGSASSS